MAYSKGIKYLKIYKIIKAPYWCFFDCYEWKNDDIIVITIGMKKKTQTISNPEELNKYLQRTSTSTWIVLGLIV